MPTVRTGKRRFYRQRRGKGDDQSHRMLMLRQIGYTYEAIGELFGMDRSVARRRIMLYIERLRDLTPQSTYANIELTACRGKFGKDHLYNAQTKTGQDNGTLSSHLRVIKHLGSPLNESVQPSVGLKGAKETIRKGTPRPNQAANTRDET